MKKSTGITRMARHLLAVILTVSLVCGLAGLEDGAYAASGTSPFANTRSSYNHNARFNGNLIVHGVDVPTSRLQEVTGKPPSSTAVTMRS